MITRDEFIAEMQDRGIVSGPVLWKRAESLVKRGFTSPEQITREAFPDVKSNTLGQYRNALKLLNGVV